MNKKENLLNRLPLDIYAEVASIFNVFKQHGYKLYMVGGCIRDLILHKMPKDIDFATEAAPDDMKKIFYGKNKCAEYQVELLATGEKYGTMTLKFSDSGNTYEITTFRGDGIYFDGRRPESVTFSKNIEDDLARRDFTCNAMAWSPLDGFIDPFGGQEDIDHQLLRAVGDPETRFKEDALRILRCVRFAFKYDFNVEENTKKMAVLYSPLIKNVSTERVGQEIMKIFQKEKPAHDGTEILLSIMKNYFQVPSLLSVVENIFSTKNIKMRLFLLFSNCCGQRDCINLDYMSKFALDKEYNKFAYNFDLAIKDWKNEELYSKKSLSRCQTEEEKKEFVQYLWRYSTENRTNRFYEKLIVLYQALLDKEPLTLKELAINGDDILSHWNITGKELGNLLEKVQQYIWERPEENKKEILLGYIGERLQDFIK